MTFSVLMSVYYKESPGNLEQSLQSLYNQTQKANEIIIVEDGPLTEELYSILNSHTEIHPEIRIVKLEKNSGLGVALNEGLKYCKNELVARMDSDDVAHEDRFERQLDIFKRFPQVEVVSAWIQEFDSETGERISVRKIPEYPFEIIHYAKKRCPVNHPVVMFKKRSVEFAGGYLPFPLFEDYYLWIRLLMNGTKFYNIQSPLLEFRTSPDMYKRRGGVKHAIVECRFQNHIRRLGFITRTQFVVNTIIRFSTRIMPNYLRKWIYQKCLR